MPTSIEVERYCRAFETWAKAARRKPAEAEVIAAGCAALRARFSGVVPVRKLCEAFGELLDERSAMRLALDIEKSCLLDRLIYGGEELREEPCPLHHGRWSGCTPDPCPAGCSYGDNVTGWIARVG